LILVFDNLKGANIIDKSRWDSIGFEPIYTAKNRSLATAEASVHFTIATIPDDYVTLTINTPEEILIKPRFFRIRTSERLEKRYRIQIFSSIKNFQKWKSITS